MNKNVAKIVAFTGVKICQLQERYMWSHSGDVVWQRVQELPEHMDEQLNAFLNPSSYPESGYSHHHNLHHEQEDAPGIKVAVLHRSLENMMERKSL